MTLDEALDEVSEQASRQVAENWREKALRTLREMGNEFDYDTSEIEDSFTSVEQTEDGHQFRVTHPLATLYEFGSEPHTIEPTDPDGVLVWEQDGETIFAKRVDHPGTKALLFVSSSRNRITDGNVESVLGQF